MVISFSVCSFSSLFFLSSFLFRGRSPPPDAMQGQ
jgi:hypothetical protein